MHASSSWMGGVIYIQNLIKAISTLPIEERTKLKIFLIVTPETPEHFYHDLISLFDGYFKADFLSKNILNRIRRGGAKLFPGLQKKMVSNSQISYIGKTIDFFYPVVSNREIVWDYPSNWAAWIPDFQHKYLPDFFPKLEIYRRDKLFKRMASHANYIVFSSQNALNDFKIFYPDASAKPLVLKFHTTIERSWLDINPETIRKKYNLPEKFFLVSNQFWKHKNHKIIIEALHILKKDSIKPTVVCTGELNDNRNPGLTEELLYLIKRDKLESQFCLLGLIPRFDQIQLMRCSLAVIQPSLFEGWSTVVEDARALNKDIILSDIPVHVEQNHPKSIFFSKNSPSELADKIYIYFNICKTDSQGFPAGRIQYQTMLSQAYARNFLKLALEVYECSSKLKYNRL
jgi:glycosyltransferase involved in cell wall biosynthesis